jgi:hypothetical protein
MNARSAPCTLPQPLPITGFAVLYSSHLSSSEHYCSVHKYVHQLVLYWHCLQRWIAYYVVEVLEVSMLFHNRTGMFFWGVEASNPVVWCGVYTRCCNVQELCVLCSHCVQVLCLCLTVNSLCSLKGHRPVGCEVGTELRSCVLFR